MIVLIASPHRPPRSYQGPGLPYLVGVLEKAGLEVRMCGKYPPSPGSDWEDFDLKRLAA